MIFYLGTHKAHWLADERFRDVPLFVSRRTLAGRKTLPRAVGPWALDSGGFTELQMHGRWVSTPEEYARDVRRFRDAIGGMVWAAPMDWMCEAAIIEGAPGFAGTGLSVGEHQVLTVRNLLDLRRLAPDLPWAPVLQGWTLADYRRCIDLYVCAGIDLDREPVVGVGTMCRRQDTREAARILESLAGDNLALHGFGFKVQGLRRAGHRLRSADSLAWSLDARFSPPMPGHRHATCANCADYALAWRARMLLGLRAHAGNGPLFGGTA